MITEILRMIETVDPADTKTLDEIDARVWCYIGDQYGFNHWARNENQLPPHAYRARG